MDDNRIGRRYAQALFGTAQRYDMVPSVEADLAAIVGLLETDQRFRHFVIAPYTSREEKVQIVERIFSDRVTALTMQVLRVMLEKRREEEIPAVYREFVALRRQAAGVLFVTVTSAMPLETDQRQALLAQLHTKLGRVIEAEFHVDSTLVGGVRVAYENYVMDGTVKGALSRLRERLKYDLLRQA